MRERGLAQKYAAGYFYLTREQGNLVTAKAELNQAAALLGEEKVFSFIKHPAVPRQEKEDIIRMTVQEGALPATRNLLLLLLQKGKFHLLPLVVEAFRKLAHQEEGVEAVEVFSSVGLTNREVHTLSQVLTGHFKKKILLQVRLDPSLLGGMVVRAGERVLDASAAGTLARLKEELVQ